MGSTETEMKALSSIGVISIGYSTAEALPLFHTLSGGSVLRVVAYSTAGAHAGLSGCDNFEVFDIYGPSLAGPPLKWVKPRQVAELAKAWGVDGVIVESFRASSLGYFTAELRRLGLVTGARTNVGDLPSGLDFLVYDALGTCDSSFDVPGPEIDRALSRLRSQGTWVEVVGYLREPVAEGVLGLAYVTSYHGVPLHVFVLEHRGGGPVKDMYERLKRVNPFTYVHVPLYSELITYCPRCGSPIAYREGGTLRSLELGPNSTCWRCGTPLPFVHLVAKKTAERVVLLSGGQTRWYDPRAVMRI